MDYAELNTIGRAMNFAIRKLVLNTTAFASANSCKARA